MEKVELPGSGMILAEQAVRSLLALKLIRKERKSHVIDLIFDEGIVLFAGLNMVPKRSCLAAYACRLSEAQKRAYIIADNKDRRYMVGQVSRPSLNKARGVLLLPELQAILEKEFKIRSFEVE